MTWRITHYPAREAPSRDYAVRAPNLDAAQRKLAIKVSRGPRRVLVEMATGTGKTCTAAAFINRLFDAGLVIRVLLLVHRIRPPASRVVATNDQCRHSHVF